MITQAFSTEVKIIYVHEINHNIETDTSNRGNKKVLATAEADDVTQ